MTQKKRKKHRHIILSTDITNGKSCTVVAEIKNGRIYIKEIKFRKVKP